MLAQIAEPINASSVLKAVGDLAWDQAPRLLHSIAHRYRRAHPNGFRNDLMFEVVCYSRLAGKVVTPATAQRAVWVFVANYLQIPLLSLTMPNSRTARFCLLSNELRLLGPAQRGGRVGVRCDPTPVNAGAKVYRFAGVKSRQLPSLAMVKAISCRDWRVPCAEARRSLSTLFPGYGSEG